MMSRNKKLVIFDFDGTLVDSMETFANIAASVMEDIYGTPFKTARRQYIETSGLPFFQQLEHIHPKNQKNGDAANRFEKEKLVGYFDQKVYPDAITAILWLKKAGILSAVSSNNFQHLVDEFVKKKNLRLDYVLGFKSESFCKGEPHFKQLMDKVGLSKKDLLFVGDSLKDAERAIAFGIDFVGKTGLFKKEEFLTRYPEICAIEDLSELSNIIENGVDK